MNDIVPAASTEIVQAGSAAEASQFIRMALERGQSATDLKTLFEVYERLISAGQKTQFDRAMTQFQADCPPMPRGHQGNFTRINREGISVKTTYSDLADIAKSITPVLRANGLSFDWEDTELLEISGQPCYRAHIRIRHECGYSERKSGPPIPMGKPVTTRDGREVQSAPIHATAVITTAQRLCLRSAFGLWSIDPDEEDAAESPEMTLTPQQAAEISKLLAAYNEVAGDGATDALKGRMLNAVGAASIDEIPAIKFAYVRDKLAKNIDAAKAKK